MRKILCLRAIIACLLLMQTSAQAQRPAVTVADECYAKNDYVCALENYQRSMLDSALVAGREHLFEARIGQCLAQLNRPNEAKAYYHKSIRHKPDYGEAWELLGNIAYNTQQYDSAALCYNKAIALATDKSDIELNQFYLGESYIKAAKYRQSIEPFSKVVSRNGRFSYTDKHIGEAYLKLERYDSALFYFRKAYNSIGPDHEAYYSLLISHGRIFRSRKDMDSALLMFNNVLARNPNHALAHWEIGIVHANQKQYQQAIDSYQKALPAYQKDTSNTLILLKNIQFCYRNLGIYDKAAATYRQMLPYSKTPIEVLKDLAVLQLVLQKRPADAEATARQMLSHAMQADTTRLEVKNQRHFANMLLGRIALQAKDTTKAIGYLREALRIVKDRLEANLTMSDIYYARKSTEAYTFLLAANSIRDTMLTSNSDYARFFGRKAEARHITNPTYKLAIKLDAEEALRYDSLQKEAIRYWPVGLVNDYSYNAKRDQCLRLLEKGVAAYGTDKPYASELHNSMGYIYSSKNDTAKALLHFNQAVVLDANNMSAWENLLKVYNMVQMYADGVVAADKLIAVLKKKKDHAALGTAFVYKGDFLWKQGKKEQAKGAYAEGQVYAPNNTTIKNRLNMQ